MANLRDIYRYVNPHTAQDLGRGDNPYALVNNTDLNDEAFYAQMQALQGDAGSFDYNRVHGPDSQITNEFSIKPGSFLDKLPAGAATFGASPYSEPGASPGSGQHLAIDGSKLPQTLFGDISRTAAVDQGTDLQNSALAYDDPNYGRIAPLMNIKGNDELPAIVQAIMAALTAGMGAIAAPAAAAAGAGAGAGGGLTASQGFQAVNAARALGSGKSPWGSLASLAGGAFGVDPSLIQGARGAMTLAELARQRGGKP